MAAGNQDNNSHAEGPIQLLRCWRPLRSGCIRAVVGSTLATWWLFSLAVTTWKIQEEEVHLDPYKLLQGHGQMIREVVQEHAFHFTENSLAQTQSGTLPLLGRPQLPDEGGSNFSQQANSVLPSLPMFSAAISEQTLCIFSRMPQFVTAERRLFLQLN